MTTKERKHDVTKITISLDLKNQKVLTMIVVSTIGIDLPTTKKCGKIFNRRPTRDSLDNRETRLNLPASSHASVPVDLATKTAFSIDEPDDPSAIPESFLLIVRTSHIFTALHIQRLRRSCNTPDLNNE
jgi:hypothetical protein